MSLIVIHILSVKIMTVLQERFFKLNHILFSFILCVIYVVLTSAHFPCANSQMSFRNWIQSIVMVATCMFLQISVTVHQTRHTSALLVSAQQCWISSENAAHCGELELHFFDKWLTEDCTWFICENSWHLRTLWFCVKYTLLYNQSLLSTQPECCLTFSWIKLQMLLRCCLIRTCIILLRHFLYLLYLCPSLDLGLCMSYLCGLFFIFISIFIMINRIISWKQTHFCLFFRICPIILRW